MRWNLAALIPLALAGCASMPPPVENLAVARSLVDQAQAAGATQFAPVELQRARDKLARADEASRRDRYADAKALAEEAEVDAELSLTRTRAAKAQQAAAQVEQSNRVLGEELQQRAP